MRVPSRRPSIARAMLGWLLASCLVAVPSFGAAITFSTALPVTQGQGILRLQIKSLRSGGDSTALDRDLSVQAFPLVGVYGATPKLALFGIVPTLDKQLDLNTPAGRRRRAATGLGDVTLLVRYTVYQRDRPGQTLRIAPFAGVEAPTGKDDERDAFGPLPAPLQLGSGSWDYLLGTIVTKQTLAWQVDASASYRFNTVANGFELGDVARLDLSYQRRLSPRELGSGVPRYLYGVVESNLLWQGRNQLASLDDPSSGGVTWALAPGLQFVTKRVIVEAAVQIPVVQNLNGSALENDYTATLSTRINF